MKEKEEYDARMNETQRKLEEDRQLQVEKEEEEALKMAAEIENERKLSIEAAIAKKEAAQTPSKEGDVKSKKKETKKKDPNAPKKASSAYIFFTTDNREKVKKAMGENTSPQELMTELGRQWRELSEAKKKPYVRKAEKDKIRYQKEMEIYKKNAGLK